MNPSLLLITDRTSLARLPAQMLVQSGIEVSILSDAVAKKKVAGRNLEEYDLILLNMYEADGNGLEICRSLRAGYDNPILILTYEQDERYLLSAYEAGADDCLVQPFSINLLLAKIQPWLRQSAISDKTIGVIEAYGFCFDPVKSEVITPQKDIIRLSQLESRLLQLLMSKSGQVVETDLIIQRVWPDHGTRDGDRHLLKALVHRLRRKIEQDPVNPEYIHTIPHQGYSFRRESY
ncbi:MAG: response regulator transcription factor [Caldilineaceae bacterium]|nr:response regulator transcription factor [Caldilineaceae bacterium]